MMILLTFIMVAMITKMTALMTNDYNCYEGGEGGLSHLKEYGPLDLHNYIYGYDYQDDSHDDQCS